MKLVFAAVDEPQPGAQFQRIFEKAWPLYRKWWLCEGEAARPSYVACRHAIASHMPELLAVYDELAELAGGGDLEARFLSLYCPPPYLSACSQAVWPGGEPLLVRNYDYDPRYFDALLFRSNWLGERRIIGMSDCLLGLLDGINDKGLAVSLTFGGPRIAAEGFGIPIIIRYVLETCTTAKQAADALARVPCHMAYNVTVLDESGHYVTVMITPGRDARVTRSPVATNHQPGLKDHARTRVRTSVDRERYLLQRLTRHPESPQRFIAAFLRPPLYSTAYASGWGTLYTAAFRPVEREFCLYWPRLEWRFSLDDFHPGERTVEYLGSDHHI